MRRTASLLLICCLAILGCTSSSRTSPFGCLAVLGCKPSVPPLLLPSTTRALQITNRQFRLAVFSFGDGTLARALSAMLLTELGQIGRFSLHEGGGIRMSSEDVRDGVLNEMTAAGVVDGYITGTVTSESATEVCFDVRLENATNHMVMFASSTCTRYRAGSGIMAPDRKAVTRLAEDISRAVKKVGNARVLSVDGRLVYLDKGRSAGITGGMVAYVVATGDAVADPEVHRSVQSYTNVDPVVRTNIGASIIGDIHVLLVEDEYSIGYMTHGDYILAGDTAFFK